MTDTRVPATSAPSSDEANAQIAREIRTALALPLSDPAAAVLSRARELPPAEEDRVIVALAELAKAEGRA